MLRKIFKDSKPEKANIVITFKRCFFTNTSETFGDEFEESFQKLLKRLSDIPMSQSVDTWSGVNWNELKIYSISVVVEGNNPFQENMIKLSVKLRDWSKIQTWVRF